MTPNWTLVGTPAPRPKAQAPPAAPEPAKPAKVQLTDEQKAEAEKRRKANAAARRKEARDKASKGEGIPHGQNPLTSEVDYTDAELEFSKALEEYRRKRHRAFPTNREVLYVLLTLGYRKVAAPGDKDVDSFLSRPDGEAVG